MTPVKQGRFKFNKDSLINTRKQVGLSQTKMAELLGVPANTLYRWEAGKSAPDAHSLAAIYSVAAEHGIKPVFFSASGEVKGKAIRNRLLVMWDFQKAGVPSYGVRTENDRIDSELAQRVGEIPNATYKAFTHPNQDQAATELEKLGWRVWVGGDEIREDIIQQARSDSGQDPHATILVLISRDESFTDLIDELTEVGVQVYVMSPTSLFGAGDKLTNAVGQRFRIPWSSMSFENWRV